MRLSAFSVVDTYPEQGPERVGGLLALARACEEARFATFWVAEHHFAGGGGCPAPPVLLAAAGAVTHRLRMGALVSVLPLHDPIELAEQYGLLDRLLSGRLELGVGSGYIPSEFEGFGVPIAEKRERFERNLEQLTRALAGEPVTARAPGAVPVRINVPSLQRPHPPLRVAVQRREAIRFLAGRGYPIALIPYATVGGLSELAEEIREYRTHLPPGTPGDVLVALHLYAGSEEGRARSALQRYLDSRRAAQSPNYDARVRADPHQADAATIEANGFARIGSPEAVAAGLEEFERIGVDEVAGLFDFGGLPAEVVVRSVRALGAAWPRPPGDRGLTARVPVD